MIQISCSIVLFNNPVNELRKTIESFLHCQKNIKLYLVDNSKEDSLRYVFNSPQIEYIFSGKNLGYGGGHNVAIQNAKNRSRYHLVLNPDIEFSPGVLEELYAFMQLNQDVGLVMPKVLYPNGKIQYLCKKFPSPADLFFRRFIPNAYKKSICGKKLDLYELRDKDYDSIMEVPNLSGCFMFMRSDVFNKVGTFDERFFLYLEDTDMCRRINQQYRTIYYPLVSIVHQYGKGSYKNFKLFVHHLISALKYFNKWGWFSDGYRSKINEIITKGRIGGCDVTLPSMEPALQSEYDLQILSREFLTDTQDKISLEQKTEDAVAVA